MRWLETRLARIEERRAESASEADIARQIVALRRQPPRAYNTEQLRELAAGDDLSGRVARGLLRLGRHAPAVKLVPFDGDEERVRLIASTYADPLGFVMAAFDWDRDASLRVVQLPEHYRLTLFDSEHGPDEWACRFLEEVGRQVRSRAFDGRTAVEPLRFATASGHGIGKSALTAWLTLWVLATRPNARGTVTANTGAQLSSKTWAEIAKWTRRSLVADWFEVTTGKSSMRMAHRDAPEAWRCDAQTCREENSESFAGQHAADSTSFYIFDEASAVPAAIWQVAEGGLSDGEPMFFAFGNPTRNTGTFFECFNSQRHRWTTRQIDSREVAITNKALFMQWADDFGEDSDFFKVRVRGVFPSASSLQFIPRDLVDEAMLREVPEIRGEPACIGVDVARFGDDQSVIRTRIGRDARQWAPIRLRDADTMVVAAQVAAHINALRRGGLRVFTFVDGGGVGGGVVDRLRQLGYDVIEVQFGSRADDPKRYANKRAEMWGRLKEWLKGGALPNDEQLATDLCAVEYGYAANGDAILLERKESMKARGLASPDDGDALALTFAHPVPYLLDDLPRVYSRNLRREYDPYEQIDREPYHPLRGL
ncbi:MAG: terminase [Pseudomonadota bacterium]